MGNVPQLRISPSGPLATDSTDDGLAPPLTEVAGYVFNCLPYDSSAPAPENLGDQQLSSVAIGPSGGSNPNNGWFYLDGYPTPQTAAVTDSRQKIGPIGAEADNMELGVGSYIVEACLTAGYTTTNPFTSTPGQLIITPYWLKDDGSILTGGGSLSFSANMLPFGKSGEPGFKGETLKAQFNVSQATVDSNGGPIKNFALKFTRGSSPTPSVLGNYDGSSGVLHFGRDSSVTIRRIK
jgi:hypothetical protein